MLCTHTMATCILCLKFILDSIFVLFSLANITCISQTKEKKKSKMQQLHDQSTYMYLQQQITAVTINTRPIALHPRRSNLSLLDINQRKPITLLFFLFWLDTEQFYQKEKKIVNILKQQISKSITVLKRRFHSTWWKLSLRAAAASWIVISLLFIMHH